MPRFVHVRDIGRGVDHLELGGAGVSPAVKYPEVDELPALPPPSTDVMPFAITTVLSEGPPEQAGVGQFGFIPSGNLPVVRSTLPEVEDHRLYTPSSTKLRRTIRGSASRLDVSRLSAKYGFPSSSVVFRQRGSVIVCVHRAVRKAVILATGNGGSGHRPPRMTEDSFIHCSDEVRHGRV